MSKRRSKHIRGYTFEDGLSLLHNRATGQAHCSILWSDQDRQRVAREMLEDDSYGIRAENSTEHELRTWADCGKVVTYHCFS